MTNTHTYIYLQLVAFSSPRGTRRSSRDGACNYEKTHTQDAFNHPRLDLSAMDAYKYICTEKHKFDVIVYDSWLFIAIINTNSYHYYSYY